ncbi:hypothetical protein ACSFA8_22790 [Variovorax sp. RT4R15]|uniref:hypothetical protein n=1 Tax=Variovorax sp. RT4R15 TaxID=3443737 RepID=UPI003F4455D7
MAASEPSPPVGERQDEGDLDSEDFDQVEQQLGEALEAVDEKLEAASAGLWQWRPERLAIAGALIPTA